MAEIPHCGGCGGVLWNSFTGGYAIFEGVLGAVESLELRATYPTEIEMLHNLAISGYRSLREIVMCLGQLNVITGPNGSGKSSIYRSLRMLADTANGRLVRSLAREGGLQSTLWAGPEKISRAMIEGDTPVQGGKRQKPVSLKLGFTGDDFCYTIELGLPVPSQSAFDLDPVIKRECLWAGPVMRPREMCVDRRRLYLRGRVDGGRWQEVDVPLEESTSMLTEYVDPANAPELVCLRESIRSWRFYDQFRTDEDSPARRAEIGTRTPVLASDGSDLAAALQTILEVGDYESLNRAIEDAFPGSVLSIASNRTRMGVALKQHGMLRTLSAAELSDGTLRFLLLVAALLTPRPPELMVLNEPETSLHPDLLPALGRLICEYSRHQQIVVVTHSARLLETLRETDQCVHFELQKTLGSTGFVGVDPFDVPIWKWPAR